MWQIDTFHLQLLSTNPSSMKIRTVQNFRGHSKRWRRKRSTTEAHSSLSVQVSHRMRLPYWGTSDALHLPPLRRRSIPLQRPRHCGWRPWCSSQQVHPIQDQLGWAALRLRRKGGRNYLFVSLSWVKNYNELSWVSSHLLMIYIRTWVNNCNERCQYLDGIYQKGKDFPSAKPTELATEQKTTLSFWDGSKRQENHIQKMRFTKSWGSKKAWISTSFKLLGVGSLRCLAPQKRYYIVTRGPVNS